MDLKESRDFSVYRLS